MKPDTKTMRCRECRGQGGSFEDRYAHGWGHYTSESVCQTCEGTGEVPAECECGAPGEHEFPPFDRWATGWICSGCKAEDDKAGQAHAEDRIPTSPEGVPLTMAELMVLGR
jgi:DnaJ-class molecular chaperone